MEIINNFSDIFLSVWDQGILGVDIFQILIGIGIFLIFLIFRGLISKLIIKKLEIISKRTTNKLDDTFVHALVGPARFLPIVLGFFIASYYMTFSSEGREIVDTINRTLITILIFWVIHQIIEPVSYILSGLDKLLTRELIGWIIKSLKILIFILGFAAVLELWGIKIGVAVRVDKFSDSSIDMYVRCFTKSDSWNEWLSVKERLAIEIKQIVEGNKASFAFPSQSIYIEKK